MMPSIIYELLAQDQALNSLGITSSRIIESQSLDSRPFNDGYFVTVSFQELTMSTVSVIARGPRVVTIAVHRSWEIDRQYRPIDKILNRIDQILLPIENAIGTDGVRVSKVMRQGRSANMADEGWKTITRTATYGVLYDEYAA
jgi:hypothetical protein